MMHEDELTVGLDLARSLVSSQFPNWADEPIVQVQGLGTVNMIYRVGPRMAARFPLRASDPVEMLRQLKGEAVAMTEMSEASPFPTPKPVAIGRAGGGYPMPWSMQTWLLGDTASPRGLAGSHVFATDLIALVAALRLADTRGRTFGGGGRGGHLPDHDAWIARCFDESERFMDVSPYRALWASLRDLPRSGIEVMSHGDLIPANLLVANGRLVGVLDTGGFAPADPALDLVAAWHLLDREERETVRAALRCDLVQWRRGAAWAFVQAMGLVWYYRTSSPAISALGESTLDRLLSDPDTGTRR
jgi:aminoglycoside phosphotransferase (APT) family kinase protein